MIEGYLLLQGECMTDDCHGSGRVAGHLLQSGGNGDFSMSWFSWAAFHEIHRDLLRTPTNLDRVRTAGNSGAILTGLVFGRRLLNVVDDQLIYRRLARL